MGVEFESDHFNDEALARSREKEGFIVAILKKTGLARDNKQVQYILLIVALACLLTAAIIIVKTYFS